MLTPHQRYMFMIALRNQHTTKGIAMVCWKLSCRKGVFVCDRQER